jgi:uncharacterized short protein YbdD (DUF466 family)
MRDRDSGVGNRESGVDGERPAFHDARHPKPDTRFAKLRRTLKLVCGMPDYERHREHALRHGCALLSEREYYDQYLAMRYGNGGTRCC